LSFLSFCLPTHALTVLAYAIGPLLLGPLSEIFGRVRVLQISNAWLILFNFVTAWAPNKEAFIIFRFLAGLGGSAPLSIGGGLIGDVWRPEERGQAFAICMLSSLLVSHLLLKRASDSLSPLLAPSIGSLIGSFVAHYSNWQWIFWSSSIFMLLVQILGTYILRETYAPVLLARKAAVIRKRCPEKEVWTKYDHGEQGWRKVIRRGLFRPFYLFGHEPIIQVFAVIQMIIYGQIYLVLLTVSSTFAGVYGWDQAKAGLGFIALAIGIIAVSQLNGFLMDKVYRYLSEKNGDKGKPEYRL
jgi:MFS family permease